MRPIGSDDFNSVSNLAAESGALVRMFKRGCVVLILISASACGGNDTPTSPSPNGPRNVTMTFDGLIANIILGR